VVRCPVCESQAVAVVLNSKPHASCSSCGATWIQEGSWQRAIRTGQRKLSIHAANGNGASVVPSNGHRPLDDAVIMMPDPVERPRRHVRGEPPAEEAVAT
jgi:hypothetical protein